MKKLVLALGLALILVAWGWQGSPGLQSAPAYGQPYLPEVDYYNNYTCDPYYPYQCYYSAPYYEDPAEQFLYYVAPDIGGGVYYGHGHRGNREEHREVHRGGGGGEHHKR